MPARKPATLPARTTTLDLITIEATAKQYGVCQRTVRRWIADGLLTAYRVGPTLLRLDRAEVDALARPIPTVGDAS